VVLTDRALSDWHGWYYGHGFRSVSGLA